jgi:hypothetical protein
MIAPSETEAGSAGRQPRRGIAWRVGQSVNRQRGNQSSALPSILISLIDPYALKIPAPKGRNFYLTENARTPFSAEPEHPHQVEHRSRIQFKAQAVASVFDVLCGTGELL